MQERLTEIQSSEQIQDLFGKLVSGKSGYKAVIDKAKPPLKCFSCQTALTGDEKFCPECGSKIELTK